jgi:hypothetical protein
MQWRNRRAGRLHEGMRTIKSRILSRRPAAISRSSSLPQDIYPHVTHRRSRDSIGHSDIYAHVTHRRISDIVGHPDSADSCS